jgi:hypothetical protein
MKVSGHGGYWIKDGSPDVTIHNAEYELDHDGTIDDVTDSGSGGVAQGLPIIEKVNALTMTVAQDDAAWPETIGLEPLTVMTLWLKRGASATYDKVTGAIVRNVRSINPQNGARRLQVTLEYGTLERGAAGP